MSAPAAAPLGTAKTVWLVTEREVGSKLRSKAFLISTLVLVLLLLGGLIVSSLLAASPSKTTVAVTSETAKYVSGRDDVETKTVDTPAQARALVKSGRADAALVPQPQGDSPFDYVVLAKDTVPQSLVASLSQGPPVVLLQHNGQNDLLRYLVAVGFGVVFLVAASMFGSTIAQSVVEEKSTRVVEILISAIPVRTLLAGKVLGNTILAMGQILVLVTIAAIGLGVTGHAPVLTGLASPLVWFAVFFLFGFVLLASLFAAAGAMVSRQEDVGATTMPLTMLILLPYFLVIFLNGNPVALTVLSYVPFSAPVAMPLRIYLGQAQGWEPILSLGILIATCAGAIWVGSRIYRNSLLRMGARVKLREALTG
ncbi:sodium ABC transporter permease [Microbacterium mangrovi]|uniref:Sodium ABC transporter permease n=1 Tax=Microbacterium mangrovi TaxID=1348253 RepID=A0A0B2A7M8_9MICO|nr:ABC transporter permease [Microbacterium mangrovi]KHK97611.1 sodium ABC transporter permease [Microbacterium mangrovi]